MRKIIWTEPFLSTTTLIYEEGELVGNMRISTFQGSATCTLYGKGYSLRRKSIFYRDFLLFSMDNVEIGIIKINLFNSNASIFYKDKMYLWKKKMGFLSDNWKVLVPNEVIFAGNRWNRGEILIKDDQNSEIFPILISGLFMHQYIKRLNWVSIIALFFLFYMLLR